MRARDRILARTIVTESGCWLWTGRTDEKGYARGTFDRRNALVHRVAYEAFVGPIPEGLTLDHVRAWGCTSRACVNPAHLEPVTLAENIRRGTGVGAINAAKTHCPQEHPYDEENTLYTSQGYRQCRACRREYGKHRDWAADYRRRKQRAAA